MEKTYHYQPKPQTYELSENDFLYLATNVKENSDHFDNPWDADFEDAIEDFIFGADYEIAPPSYIIDNMIQDLKGYYHKQFIKTYVFKALVSINIKASSKKEAQDILDNMDYSILGEYASEADWGEPKLLAKEKNNE